VGDFILGLKVGPEHTIPTWAIMKMGEVLTTTEIKDTLDQMGLDKAPGPDGLTYRFIQKNWGWLGPDIIKEIHNVFRSKKALIYWMECHTDSKKSTTSDPAQLQTN
jgi:hypothetical protein